ncbi:PAS domain-containing sensor histidine kinase [Photobacterium sp. Alg240-V54]|uniref:sensor histidine kinase n=1 Tax=Photobacterium sp. Alg240-V54 TaxID=2305995 RepID=UPI0013D52153|nr:ATP-binding protein [Photobacterium sp. Alg240-V54]
MSDSSVAVLALNQQVERYRQVLQVMPVAVILLDEKGLITEANQEALRLLGEPLIGQRWGEIIQRSFAPQDDDGHEVSLRSGRKVKLAISASAAGQLIVITDLTETRQLQSRLSEMQRLSSLGRMVASLAHQVRTPLASALLYAENLASSGLTAITRNRFQTKLVDRLYDLEKQVNDMLLFAKGGDNKVVSEFNVESLLNRLETLIETQLMSEDVDFSIDCDDETLLLLGNENALASAVGNLITNAIQMSGKGCRVAVRCQQQGQMLLLSVSDNGPGIAAQDHQKVLEPFYTTRQQGTGLGLAVVQMVVAAHKGQLQLQSQLGYGATFTLLLPLAASLQAA